MRFIPVVVVCLGLCACDSKRDRVLIISEVNMLGTRHDLAYRGDTLARITYSSFITTSETDTTQIDTLIRRDIDSLIYEADNSVSLLRTFSRHGSYGKIHRRFRFNSDNLLSTISRFNGKVEYVTDSLVYDYTTRKAYYFDLVNKLVEELEYDRDDNITAIVQKRIEAAAFAQASHDQEMPKMSVEPVQVIYNYFSTSDDPFLVNLDDDQLLFGCFNRGSVGLYWNGGLRPQFRSANNVQAVKQTRHNHETNALYEYQLKDGLPMARYGGYGVVYYRYRRPV